MSLSVAFRACCGLSFAWAPELWFLHWQRAIPQRTAGGLNEITWITCSAQRLVRRKQSILKRVSAAADDGYNIKLKTLRERTKP